MSTPRTNDAEYFCTCTMQGDAFVPSNAVPADFARQLERDLAAATARVARLEETLRPFARFEFGLGSLWRQRPDEHKIVLCGYDLDGKVTGVDVTIEDFDSARAALGEKGGQ